MIPVDQTKFGESGNCFDACLASILEIGIDKFPNFKGVGWAKRYNIFLQNNFDMQILSIYSSPDILFSDDGEGINTHHIITGPGPRGFMHAVVGLNGKMVHDPHPDRSGLLEVEYYEFIIKCFR